MFSHAANINKLSSIRKSRIENVFYICFMQLQIIHLKERKDRSLVNKGKFIICNPFVAIQQDGYSDNSKKYQNYNFYTQNRQLF